MDNSEIIKFNADATYSSWSYEHFLMLQPSISVDGMWFANGAYFIYCLSIGPGDVTENGESLVEWFNQKCRAITAPVSLTSSLPDNAIRVPGRSVEERVDLIGSPLTIRDIVSILSRSIPRSLPDFDFKTRPPVATLYVSRDITSAEKATFETTLKPYLGRMRLEIIVDASYFSDELGFRHPAFIQGDIDLIPARRLPRGISSNLRRLSEEDEDTWVTRRRYLFAGNPYHIDLPNAFGADVSKCLINASVLTPRNLRMAISLYGQVQIAMPLTEAYSRVLNGLQVSEDDLVELSRRGRVVFLLPQSLDRYPITLIHKIAEANQDSLLLSRSLATHIVQERKRRIPLLYAPLSGVERHKILEALVNVEDQVLQPLSRGMADVLGQFWSSSEILLESRGAMGLMSGGMANLIAMMIKIMTGRDLELEMMSAGASVEWAAALGSTVIPYHDDVFSEQKLTEILASAYSGVRDLTMPSSVGDVEVVVDGLLSVNNDASILDVASIFDGDEVNRIRRLVLSTASDNDSIQEAVEHFNNRVSGYERDQARLKKIDLLGLVGAISAVPLAAQYPEAAYIPLGIWITKYLLDNSRLSLSNETKIGEFLHAINSFESRDVVMVSRLRSSISNASRH
jgi:hypothetical protein